MTNGHVPELCRDAPAPDPAPTVLVSNVEPFVAERAPEVAAGAKPEYRKRRERDPAVFEGPPAVGIGQE